MPSPDPRFLLVTRIGPKSLHRRWLVDRPLRSFDVVLSAYSDAVAPVEGPGVTFERRPGQKVRGYGTFLTERRALWSGYDYVCLLDEDIETTADALDRAFALTASHDLLLAQPALTHDSHFTYAGLLRQARWQLRYVNYIEMMCPILRCDALDRVVPLYLQGLESGIDLVWCNLLAQGDRSFAVLDAVPVRHTEPVGIQRAANGFKDGLRYEDDIAVALERYDLPWLSCVPYAGLTPRGRLVTGRVGLFVSALGALAAVPRQAPITGRLRFVATHLWHILTRTPRNIAVSHPADVISGAAPEGPGR